MAHPCLIVSDDGKQVRYGKNRTKGVDGEEQNEKFDTYLGVLAKEGFSSGCFYFEVQVKGHTLWDLGVVRESINRIGDFDLHPRDGYWIVGLRYEKYLSYCPKELFSLNVKPQKVGVFCELIMKVWSSFMMWSPCVKSTLTHVSVLMRNSIHLFVLVISGLKTPHH